MTDSLFTPPEPLAARMRPRDLEEYAGQEHLLAPGKPLGDAIRRGDVGSIVLWGPPGTGKTTLARLVARHTSRHFVPFSAVSEGIPRVREIIAEAEESPPSRTRHDPLRRRNPSAEPGAAGCLSAGGRTGDRHADRRDHREPLLRVERGAPQSGTGVGPRAALAEDASAASSPAPWRTRAAGRSGPLDRRRPSALLARVADGDARRALTVLEAAAQHVGEGGVITAGRG